MMPKKKNSLLCSTVLILSACNPSLPPPQALPDAASPAAQLMTKRCGGCHGVPNPGLHPANEWPNVVFRMQKHITKKGRPALAPDEKLIVLEYLQKHARP